MTRNLTFPSTRIVLAAAALTAACGSVNSMEPPDASPQADAAPTTYVVQGTASGLIEAVAMELRFTGGSEILSVTGDGPFAFQTELDPGASYTVLLVDEAPCVLDGETGTVTSADAEVTLTCDGVVRLSDLRLTGPVVPDLGFAPDKREYQVETSLLQQSTEVIAVPAWPEATITVANMPVMSGEPSAPVPLGLGANQIAVQVSHPSGLEQVYQLTVSRAAAIAQRAYGKASNPDAGDRFGYSVAVDGDTLVVGATGEDSAATGVGGNEADNSRRDSGAVYVFRRAGAAWAQEAYIKASNPDAADQFGWSVALSGDTLAVGAFGEDSAANGINGNQQDNTRFDSGAVYVFRRTDGAWAQEAYIKASNPDAADQFGWSVALSGDTLAVSAPRESSAATGINRNQLDNSSRASGAVYVFRRADGAWAQQAYIKASNTGAEDQFGTSVALDGDNLAVGAIWESSASTGINGNQANDIPGGEQSGAVYVFRRSGAAWAQEAYVKASNTDTKDHFGTSVALSGDTLVVGAPGEASRATGVNGNQQDDTAVLSGAVYVFRRSSGLWAQQAYVKASNPESEDQFGASVALRGDTLAVGAPFESSAATGIDGSQQNNNAPFSGAVYIFHRSGDIWAQQAYVKASNTEQRDHFGTSVALGRDTLVASALLEASAATGINGNQQDNTFRDSGAVYISH